jgi:GDSL-like Lipase/Acylhydrolase family
MSEHIALLGDSIFDNAAYTRGLPDVVSHLRHIVPNSMTVTLLAVDGSTTADVARMQLPLLPSDVTHAAVSMGGNDAILHADALDLPITSTQEALAVFGERAAAFEASYRTTLAEITRRVPHVAVCTIYNANLSGDEAARTRVGLMMFNDAILRIAFECQLPVVDLRLVVVEPRDYANALEPSSRGAEKIARSIAAAFGFNTGRGAVSKIFAA